MVWSKVDRTVAELAGWGLLLCGGIWCSPDAGRTEAAMRQLRYQPVRALSDQASGPGWFHGKLVGSTESSPLGTAAALWVIEGVVETDEADEHVCYVQHAPALALAADGLAVKLEVPPDLGRTWLHEKLRHAPLHKEQPAGSVCTDTRKLSYHEVAIPAGTPVWISGCRRADAIGPCDSGHDGLSTTSRAELASELATRVSGSSARHPLWGLLLLLLAFTTGAANLSVPPRRKTHT